MQQSTHEVFNVVFPTETAKIYQAYAAPPSKVLDECIAVIITKTRLFKCIENFTTKKWKFSDEKLWIDIFHISAQNIDCGYSLEPPRWGGSNEYPQSMF